ncbi:MULTISPECIES: pantoate kinase [Halomicrobium]|uniref:Pantoate kinase n=2 Tax=Halomicrobium mukohataei TaxID=57705 RepID=C7P2K7_HALMD|nr:MULTISPECIES: pantoate kinase [Halomicrobium]ACV49322.1 GHMP kinase [Halomicrobium mukohataei DSM 12286]QCD64718.1 sugar kinase [Halomicrobium mukohataei]QFR19525.1 sugar kinase [Halomicrobium sp. ZPS1]
MTDEATAFVPGHVTGFFTTDPADDPTKAGSRGGGLALADGVTVTVERSDERSVTLDGVDIEIEAVERVLDALRATVAVRAETPLPLGSGFGVSGATALGAALGTNALLERGLSENELVTIAHGAEVQAGTGLGDVVAQARGGVPLRLEPGGPQDNYIDAIPARGRVEYHVIGELSTEAILDGDTAALTRAGEKGLSRVVKEPTTESFLRASRQFAREAGLLTDDVRSVLEDVAAADGDGAMAMLGETVFTVGSGLTDAGYDATITEIHPGGATVLDSSD